MPDEFVHRPLPASVAAETALPDGAAFPADDASDGRTLFDTPSSTDGGLTVVFPEHKFARWRSQALLHVASADGKTYLAQVSAGPYAAPVGLPATNTALVTTQIEGALFTPPYHGWCGVDILGEVVDGQTIVPLYRPRPNSPVRLLTPDEVRAALDCDGDLRLGRALGHEDLYVGLRSDEKAHVPRHTLAVGTTGAGKSTFLAGWIEKLSKQGFCVVLLDVEGEYASLHRPAESNRILPALKARGLEPGGIDNSYLLVPTDAEPSDGTHPRTRHFCIEFENLSPHVAAEVLGGNEAQTERFQLAYDTACELLAATLSPDARRDHEERLRTFDAMESGYPGLRLGHVLDAAEAICALVAKRDVAEHHLHADGFRAQCAELARKVAELGKRAQHQASWQKTVGLLAALYRSGLFDRGGRDNKKGKRISPLNYAKMVAPGAVHVLDLAGVDSPAHRNLLISDVLRGVLAAQDELYEQADAGKKPKTVVIIEEAHEFVSADRVAQMPAVFGQIQRIARRGRKRWLGLVFATQFPQHLPGELFTLCNNRVLMRLADEPTVRKLQHSVGGVPEHLWSRLKNLPTGQAIVSAHGIEPAMLVSLDPGRCALRMVD